MRKGLILNGDILEVIARMGHMDEIVIADAGLPIPLGVRRIDLALRAGTPGFVATLATVLEEFVCESACLAEEIKVASPAVEHEVRKTLGVISVTYISHEDFKQRCHLAKAVIRTGECSPYANIILRSGVFF
jgi:D-ribose pyranase